MGVVQVEEIHGTEFASECKTEGLMYFKRYRVVLRLVVAGSQLKNIIRISIERKFLLHFLVNIVVTGGQLIYKQRIK